MARKRSLWVLVGILVAVVLITIQSPLRHRLGGVIDGDGNRNALTGFVVADAHFGAAHRDQPTNEDIQNAMHHIYQQFPELDVMWDAGDAHHRADDDDERGDWLTYLAGEGAQSPLYYTGGNHELTGFSTPYDPEERALQLGSLAARPYYSIDIKNIHLISLPELIDANYLSAEELAWLDLDLQLNQDKTILILSHNALQGIKDTDDQKIAYRRLTNSDAIFERMEQYPNIRAWIHGHNHTYDVVERDGSLFVSAGRMGGFNGDRKTDLKLDKDNLGGIYFKITRNQFILRAYNASKHAFMDELGYPELSMTLEFDTALKPKAPARLSYGYGLARDGQRIPFYNHHLGASQRELFVSGAPGAVFSDNSQFTAFSEDRKRGKTLNAIVISSKDAYEWLNPTVRLLPQAPGKLINVSLSAKSSGRWAYYRVAPNHTYTTTLKLDAEQGGQQVSFQSKLRDSDGNIVITFPPEVWTLTEDPQTLRYQVQVPDLVDYPSIYQDPTSDRQFQLSTTVGFTNLEHPVELEQFSMQLGDDETTIKPTVLVNEQPYASEETLSPNQYVHFDLSADSPQRSVFEAQADGSGLLTFLVRETAMKWQVRNAMATQQGNALMIGPMRNHFGNYRDILLTPLGQHPQPYLNVLSHVEQAKVVYDNSDIRIDLLDVDGDVGKLTVVADKQPRQVVGAKDWTFKNGHLDIVAAQNDQVTVRF